MRLCGRERRPGNSFDNLAVERECAGAITELAVAGGVLTPKDYVAPPEKLAKTGCRAGMRAWLTYDDHHQYEMMAEDLDLRSMLLRSFQSRVKV